MQMDHTVPSPTETQVCQLHYAPHPLLPTLLEQQEIHVTVTAIYLKWSKLAVWLEIKSCFLNDITRSTSMFVSLHNKWDKKCKSHGQLYGTNQVCRSLDKL
jgi:hypothetical protein